MNKRELIEKVAEKNGTSKVEAAKAVNAVIATSLNVKATSPLNLR